jgi:hypothetical protein
VGEPRIKGVALRAVDACYLELRGARAHARAHELMASALREAYASNLILAASWYPLSWYRDVFRAYRAANSDGPDLARQIGYQSIRRDMRGTYKQWFARMLSPQIMLSLASRLFNTYYDTGRFEVAQAQRGYAHARFSGCVGWDANLWQDLLGSSMSLLEIAGAKEVRLRVKAGGQAGDTGADFEAHWV